MTQNSVRPRVRPGIMDIDAYQPGSPCVARTAVSYKLSSNETPLGPSPAAIAAYREAASTLAIYPDGSATTLRAAIGARYRIDPQKIICGSGSDELLSLIAHAYLGQGDETIYSQYGFLVYPIVTRSFGATPIPAPERNDVTDIDAILDRLTDRTRIVFLANPNNPTGSYLSLDTIHRLHAGLPRDVLLVLDAAYAEYVQEDDYSSGMELIEHYENVVMTRTFSKIHGLASLRLGWLYGPPHVIDALNRIRDPFNVSGPAMAAGIAAINDNAHVERSIAHNSHWLTRLTEQIRALGAHVTPSVANFLLVHFDSLPETNAKAVHAYLNEHGIAVRRVDAYGLPNALRISVGTEEANRSLLSTLRAFLTTPDLTTPDLTTPGASSPDDRERDA